MGKNIALAAGWILAVVLGGVLYVELNTVRALNEKLDAAQATVDSIKETASRVVGLEEKCAALEETVAKLTAAPGTALDVAGALEDKMTLPEDVDASALVQHFFGGSSPGDTEAARAGEGGPANPFTAMFEGEEGERFMEEMLPTQVDMQYGQLYQELNLTPERKAALRDALIEHTRKQTAAGLAFMRGDQEDIEIELPGEDDLMASLAEVLSPDELAKVQAYQDTLPERMMRQNYDLQLGIMAGDLPVEVRSHTVDVLIENLMPLQNPEEMGAMADFDSMSDAFDNTITVLEQELAPEYVDRVRAFIQQQRAGVELAAQMFGREAEVESAE